MNIDIKCQGSHSLALDDLTVLQGELKSLSTVNYNKLKKEILELGFSSPIHVWAQNGVNYILDGTQRCRTLRKMTEEGYGVPLLPVVNVEAADVNEAKRKVLALTSQYGKMEGEGLYEFISDSDITVGDIEESFHFPEINLDKFKEEFYEPTQDKDLGQEAVDEQEFLIVCELTSEAEQSALYAELQTQGIKCKIM
jgi:hypothetical protein